MVKLFVQLSFIIALTSLLTACTNRDGDAEEVEEEVFHNEIKRESLPFIDSLENLMVGEIEFEPVNSSGSQEVLFSYQTSGLDNVAGELTPIASSEGQLMVSLNTIYEDAATPEITIVVGDDTVRAIDHITKEMAVLKSFGDKVCEIIPVEKVVEENIAGNTQTTILHADYFYVMTTESGNVANACVNSIYKKRYYKLSPNYQFDIEDGHEVKINELELHLESLARSKLVFGWVRDEINNLDVLEYGYLGYGHEERKLVLYDKNHEPGSIIWSQDRTIETVAVNDDNNEYAPDYLFNLTQLEQFQYMLQLGRDVFVFDGGEELLSRSNFGEGVDTVLNDRVFVLDQKLSSSGKEVIPPVDVWFDNDEMILIDNYRVLKFDYLKNYTDPLNAEYPIVRTLPNFNIDNNEYLDYQPYSQFDNILCETITDADKKTRCQKANDLQDADWQFVTDCELSLGCSVSTPVDDFCVLVKTSEEQTLCTPSEYTHLSELDDQTNNAEFVGYFQYGSEFIDDMDIVMHDNSLFVTARLNEREALLRFFYKTETTDVKSNREQVLFGASTPHYGLSANLVDGNLYVNSLLSGPTRQFECYQGYKKVECTELSDEVCSGESLVSSCSTGFTEYNSIALFCSTAQINGKVCSDSQLTPTDQLSVVDDLHDAKWISILDASTGKNLMYLLSGLRSNSIDEGVLVNPELLSVDIISNDVVGATASIDENSVIGVVPGNVESVIGGWFENLGSEPAQRVFQVIADEIVQGNGLSYTKSLLEQHIIDTSRDEPIQHSAVLTSVDESDVTNAAASTQLVHDDFYSSIESEGLVYFDTYFDRPITRTSDLN